MASNLRKQFFKQCFFQKQMSVIHAVAVSVDCGNQAHNMIKGNSTNESYDWNMFTKIIIQKSMERTKYPVPVWLCPDRMFCPAEWKPANVSGFIWNFTPSFLKPACLAPLAALKEKSVCTNGTWDLVIVRTLCALSVYFLRTVCHTVFEQWWEMIKWDNGTCKGRTTLQPSSNKMLWQVENRQMVCSNCMTLGTEK